MADKCGVYLLKFPTGIYVGSSKHVRRRFLRHLRDLQLGRHSNRFMQSIYDRHGSPSFTLLIECIEADLLCCEQRYIDELRPRLNLSPTAGRNIGHKHTQETRERMKVAGRAAWLNRSRIVNDDQRQKISESSVGRSFSEATRAKISAAKLGHLVSDETRAKISATKRAKIIYEGRDGNG